MTSWLVCLTIGLPWLGALCVWLVGDSRPRLQHTLAVLFSVSAGLASLALLGATTDEVVLRIGMGGPFGEFTFVPDGLGVFLAGVAAVVGCLTVVYSTSYMRGEAQLGRYYGLVLFFIGAMAGLALSGSILLMFIFWEITAFCSYALISFHNDDPKAVAGGIKALVITQLGGVCLLAGGLVIYNYLGTYEISVFLTQAQTFPPGVLALLAFGFLVAAAAKSAQVPLHTWLPDAMEAPTPVTALIHAATMVNAGVYLLIRFFPAFEAAPGWKTSVMVVGLLSALLAGLMALVATDLKRALAYSTISQLGYMVYAIGVGAIFASEFHLLSHALFKALLFLGAGAAIHAIGTRDMRAMGALGAQMPFVRTTFVIGALALAGLPITNGFFSKELIMEGGLNGGPSWALLAMLAGVGITALYSLRIVYLVFYGKPRCTYTVHDAPAAMRIALGVLAAGTLTSWLVAGPFGRMLAGSRWVQAMHVETTAQVVAEVVRAPITWVVMAVILICLAAWPLRSRLAGLTRSLQPASRFAQEGFGFDWLNQQVIQAVVGSASALRGLQTGQLNWNLLGILGSLVVVLVFLIWVL